VLWTRPRPSHQSASKVALANSSSSCSSRGRLWVGKIRLQPLCMPVRLSMRPTDALKRTIYDPSLTSNSSACRPPRVRIDFLIHFSRGRRYGHEITRSGRCQVIACFSKSFVAAHGERASMVALEHHQHASDPRVCNRRLALPVHHSIGLLSFLVLFHSGIR